MTDTAEHLLHSLQRDLSTVSDSASRPAVWDAEGAYGAQATRDGRRLHEIVCGSPAWSLFERPGISSGLPRVHGLTQCEPVLQVMRDSGELDERERLLCEREEATLALWRRDDLSDAARWLESEAVYEEYAASVRQLTAAYRPFYRLLQRAAGAALPLGGPRVRSRPTLLPPLMAALFALCHGEERSTEIAGTGCVLRAESNAPLDALTWDIATLAVSAFFTRTNAKDAGSSFPFLLQDYAEWRRLDPRKRTPGLRRQIEERLDFLCSDRLYCESTVTVWQPHTETGRRVKTPVTASGSFLEARGRFFQRPPRAGHTVLDAADGRWLALGPWAQALVENRTMHGVCLRRLAEYDLQREQWERQIGWYLTFQMHTQASKMTVADTEHEGRTRTTITPQRPLKMGTVLDKSGLSWQRMAQTNPGKVIQQWTDALETLRRDGIVGPIRCLDGPLDGSDLTTRGRLAAMLERRYEFIPGKDLLPHVRAKAQKKPSFTPSERYV